MAVKIRHKRTGLFLGKAYKKYDTNPWREYKTNLRKKGRIYESITEGQLLSWYKHYNDENGVPQLFNRDDFEIVTV